MYGAYDRFLSLLGPTFFDFRQNPLILSDKMLQVLIFIDKYLTKCFKIFAGLKAFCQVSPRT